MYRIINRLWVFIVLVVCVCAWVSCGSKDTVLQPEDQVVQYLTGTGNRYWRIKEIYVNGTNVTLTPAQREYTKTYTIGFSNDKDRVGTFADADGYRGNWELTSVSAMDEVITNNPSGPVTIKLTIRSISAFGMDVQYVASSRDTVRTVYFAY